MDADRPCEGCGQPLGPSRPNRRHHDARCRKAAHLRRQHERQAAPAPVDGVDRQAVLEEATSEPRLLVYIARAAQTNWRAAAWMLERRYPERWGGRGEPERPVLDPDPFAEVDELANRRRARQHD